MNGTKTDPNMEKKCPQCGAALPSGVLEGLCPACLLRQGAAADTAVPRDPAPLPFQPPTVEEVARMFPQLEILSFLGKGGMGAVYKARQPALDRVVALKILPAYTAGGPGFIERFNREARALARLSHPNIVAVYEFGQVNALPFFIMEFVDGLNLRELERAGKLSAREALQIVPQICEALQFAHDEGIVHRDIKPENILLDKKGRVKIADFGIAKIIGNEPEVDLTQTKDAIGTPHYMAPEQMEKPTTVDHRADIFSLGVVFYEMLTGELPIGKFAPPSSRKIEVDVRLDEVVLRALEKDPNLRYQQVRQVKTAVDTIAGTAAPSPPPFTPSGEALAQVILAQDYDLSVRSCFRRGWALVKGDFWPLVGVTALVVALFSFVSSIGGAMAGHTAGVRDSSNISSALALLVWGPLAGGLSLYFIKKIRREKTTVETAFCGFSPRFLQLFLAGFVTTLLAGVGFFCLLLPGIYLSVAWMFTLPLVIDKGLDFWTAMELSRKVVTKHWWKLLGLTLLSMLLLFSGVLMCVVGIFVMTPLVMAALNYAYEDIFGAAAMAAMPPIIGAGPSGTVVMPASAARPPFFQRSWWTPVKVGLAAIVVLVGLIGLMGMLVMARHGFPRIPLGFRRMSVPELITEIPDPNIPQPILNGDNPTNAPTAETEVVPIGEFGPVMEREIHARLSGTNQFLDLDTGQLLTPPADIASVLTTGSLEQSDLFWRALSIPQDSSPFRYVNWLRENGVGLMYDGNGQIIGFDGMFSLAHGDSSTNWDNWDGLTPAQVQAAKPGSVHSATQLDSREPGGPLVNLLTRDQSVNWFFKTRAGAMGVLQLVDFSNNAARIRYKLLQHSTNQTANVSTVVSPSGEANLRAALSARIEAASEISAFPAKDKAMAAIATDAAKAGEGELVRQALDQMSNFVEKDKAARASARELARQGQRKEAVEIAKTIMSVTTRDDTLAELAR